MAWAWVYDPQSGGIKIPSRTHNGLLNEVRKFLIDRPEYPEDSVKLRFKNQFCYIDILGTSDDGQEYLIPLCRLRHFTQDRWSLALASHSGNLRYVPCDTTVGTFTEILETLDSFIL